MKYFPIFFIGCWLLFSCVEKKKKFIIGVSQCSKDEWRDKMNMEMQNEAALNQKTDLIILSANDDTQMQIADIRYLISQKIDLLILTPNEVTTITPLIEEIYDKGIPVILVDRKIQSDKYTAFIGADNYQIGKEVGNYVVNWLHAKGNIVEIRGLASSSPAIERHEGFYDIIRNYPELNLVFDTDAGWLKDEGGKQMREALNKFHKIDLVYVQNDRMAKGAYIEAEKAGRADEMVFLGIDALPGEGEGIDMVLQNKLEATFLYPTGGDKTIELALSILEKRAYTKENILATAVVDKSNAKILKLQSYQITEQQEKIGVLNQRVINQLEKYTQQRNIIYIISILGILFLILLIGIFKAYRTKNKLNVKLAYSYQEINRQKEKLEKKQEQLISLSKQLEEATHAKLVFFTDISHDFRTPLTLISGPVEIMLHQAGISSQNRQWLNIIKKNVTILLRLVNQIIEFRQIETNNIKLNLTSNNLAGLITDWNILFTETTSKNKIHFTYKAQHDVDFTFQFDVDKIERVYFNLLSNAFKFSPKGGFIEVELSKVTDNNQDFVKLTVNNTGNKLSEKEIRNIFERFYRVDTHVEGSGIGLALVKALVELHHGTINAISSDNMTMFTIHFPFLENHAPETLPGSPDRENRNHLCFDTEIILSDNETDQYKTATLKKSYTILLIDDNEEIRFYIRTILSQNYQIIEACDGEEGLLVACDNNIDIIISDIMMPKLDGVELCRRIKEDKRICHIPVILLTACSLDEQRIKGFESGADAYISKPFNPQILEVRVKMMIENREKIREHFRSHILFEESADLHMNTMDQELIKKFRDMILDRISDSELNVENISREFGFSRAQFYRKIKAITNQGPNEFIRAVRLNKSVELLNLGKNVSEVAYDVGFTSPSYFAKCFKEYFNRNPSQKKDNLQ